MFNIHKTTKDSTPRVPYEKIKDAVLGKKYDLSLVFIGSTRSRSLNKKYRKKDKSTNILSFPLSATEGEIYVDLKQVKATQKAFGRNFNNFMAFLFIHGLLHLKGYEHSSKMEIAEEKVRKQFGI